MNLPDQPDIDFALRTGFPRPERYIRCVDCGKHLAGTSHVYLVEDDPICADCCKKVIEENYTFDEIASAMCITVFQAMDRMDDEPF